MNIFLLVLVLIALVASGRAHADPGDKAFLDAMKRHNIQNDYGDRGLINFAHSICVMRETQTEEDIIKTLAPQLTRGMTVDILTYVIHAAEQDYCPQMLHQIIT